MAQMVAFTLGDPGCEQAGLLLSHTPSRGQQAGFWIRERCESHRMPRLASDGCHPELPQSTLGLPGVPGEGMSLPPHPRAPSPPVTSLPPHFCARITPLSPHPCVLRPLPSPHPLTPAAPRGTAPRKERKDAGGRAEATAGPGRVSTWGPGAGGGTGRGGGRAGHSGKLRGPCGHSTPVLLANSGVESRLEPGATPAPQTQALITAVPWWSRRPRGSAVT